MLYGKEVFRTVKVSDDVQPTSLGIMDQIRLIISSSTSNDAAELDKNEKVSKDRLMKIASLTNFVDKAIQRMMELGENSVTIKVSHEFRPYFDEVFKDPNGHGRYFNFSVRDTGINQNIKHYLIVRISKKVFE